MTDRAVSLETDGFPNNTNPVILGGACTHLTFDHPGPFGTVNMWNHPYQLNDCMYVQDLKYSLLGESSFEMASGGDPCIEMLKSHTLSH